MKKVKTIKIYEEDWVYLNRLKYEMGLKTIAEVFSRSLKEGKR